MPLYHRFLTYVPLHQYYTIIVRQKEYSTQQDEIDAPINTLQAQIVEIDAHLANIEIMLSNLKWFHVQTLGEVLRDIIVQVVSNSGSDLD